MEQNENKTDRLIRLFVAVVLGCVAYLYGLWWLYIVALVPLITGITGYCFLYTLFKINTNKKPKSLAKKKKRK